MRFLGNAGMVSVTPLSLLIWLLGKVVHLVVGVGWASEMYNGKYKYNKFLDCKLIFSSLVTYHPSSFLTFPSMISACPEKIAEFMERKAEVKKETRRPRKSSKATANEADRQLQGLLLSIESESNALHEPAANSRKPEKMNKDSINKINFQLHGLLLDIEQESHALPEPADCLPITNSDNVIPELIDLCSPSPLPLSCKDAKSRKSTDLHVDIIDICQSENEASSPEHEKKARELRSFINSIRKDLH